MCYIETVGWMNDESFNYNLTEKNPVEENPIEFKDRFDGEFWTYSSANRHVFEFNTREDAEECIDRIEKFRNSENTEDPFEKGKCILGEEE